MQILRHHAFVELLRYIITDGRPMAPDQSFPPRTVCVHANQAAVCRLLHM